MASTEQDKAVALTKIQTIFNNRPSLLSSFIIFSILYFPVAALYLNQGLFAFITLTIYSVALVLAGLVLIARFVNTLAAHADSNSGKFGSLFSNYISHFLVPVAMFKVVGLVIWKMLPPTHNGPLCTIVRFIQDLFAVFKFQHSLDIVILVTLPVMVALALVYVGKKN